MNYSQIWSEIRLYFFQSTVLYYALFVAGSFLPFWPEPRMFIKQPSILDFALSVDNVHFFANKYLCQHNFVFLPGYVTILAVVKWIASFIVTDNELQFKVFVVMGLVLNNLFLAISSINLYRVTELITNSKRVAKFATILFFFCPGGASLRMLYSESLFCFLTFWALRLAYEKMPIWEKQLETPLEFLKTNRLSLALFFVASITRSVVVLYSPVFGISILYALYNEIRNRRRINKIIGIIGTGVLTLAILASFMPLYNLYGYWQYCSQKPYCWFCEKTMFNMYDALQARYWKLKLRPPLYFWGEGDHGQMVGIRTLITIVVPFRWYYINRDKVGLLVSYILLVVTIFSYAYLSSTARFVSTNPLFHINMALFLLEGQNWLTGNKTNKGLIKTALQLGLIWLLTLFLTQSTFKMGQGGGWF